jgi:hypothetical protein
MAKTKRGIKGVLDTFVPADPLSSDNMARPSKHVGGRPRHREKLGPTQKATFRIPVTSVERLENAWLKARAQNRRITKSALIGLALDQIMPRIENGELLAELEDYLA